MVKKVIIMDKTYIYRIFATAEGYCSSNMEYAFDKAIAKENDFIFKHERFVYSEPKLGSEYYCFLVSCYSEEEVVEIVRGIHTNVADTYFDDISYTAYASTLEGDGWHSGPVIQFSFCKK